MMLSGQLLIVGCGGFGIETIELVRRINASGGAIEIVGMADDDTSLHGDDRLGVPILGPIDEVVRDHEGVSIVLTIGSPSSFDVRQRIVDRLDVDDERYAILVHPTAVVPESANLGVGSIVQANVVLTADVVVGRHVLIMPSVVLTHGDRVDDFATLASGVLVAGEVQIGSGAYIGAGSLIRERLRIGDDSLVGMGATVLESVPSGEVWVGTPARPLRR
jgi:sugar O-acyltransferase (sialic acid O-acetyltransferase NeuD family)